MPSKHGRAWTADGTTHRTVLRTRPPACRWQRGLHAGNVRARSPPRLNAMGSPPSNTRIICVARKETLSMPSSSPTRYLCCSHVLQCFACLSARAPAPVACGMRSASYCARAGCSGRYLPVYLWVIVFPSCSSAVWKYVRTRRLEPPRYFRVEVRRTRSRCAGTWLGHSTGKLQHLASTECCHHAGENIWHVVWRPRGAALTRISLLSTMDHGGGFCNFAFAQPLNQPIRRLLADRGPPCRAQNRPHERRPAENPFSELWPRTPRPSSRSQHDIPTLHSLCMPPRPSISRPLRQESAVARCPPKTDTMLQLIGYPSGATSRPGRLLAGHRTPDGSNSGSCSAAAWNRAVTAGPGSFFFTGRCLVGRHHHGFFCLSAGASGRVGPRGCLEAPCVCVTVLDAAQRRLR
ncbi:hypothetical protein GGR56DRAFT_55142 [Xylariaceae sp. FL0804]|nr:hypothetical protein GGR56DRAFT_55142 [Xylariaceae sp. FL0804]